MEEFDIDRLAMSYPHLIQKSNDVFSIGNGWYNIMDALCGIICRRLDSLEQSLEWLDKDDHERIELTRKNIKEEIEKLPSFRDVKEKFGALRIQMKDLDPSLHGAIQMASAISETTCEYCGKPGHLRKELSWIKVLCDEHLEERKQEYGLRRATIMQPQNTKTIITIPTTGGTNP